MQQIFLDPNSAWACIWLLTYLAGVLLIYFKQRLQNGSVFEFIFPRRIYAHDSARADYTLMGFSSLVGLVSVIQGTVIQFSFSALVSSQIIYFFGVMGLNSAPENLISPWFYIFLFAVVLDFGVFLGHWIMHHNSWLWHFHKVHHSAEVLTPLTQFRFHPFENVFMDAMSGSIVGMFLGMGFVLGWIGPAHFELDGIWIIYLLFNVTSHFRHSHFWISFGPVLSRFFSSPAMHQIHHSKEERHLNKNFATVFSFWDTLFGTLYVPMEREQFAIGLCHQDVQARYRTWQGLLWSPFVDLTRQIICGARRAEKEKIHQPTPMRP